LKYQPNRLKNQWWMKAYQRAYQINAPNKNQAWNQVGNEIIEIEFGNHVI
jgi:hypothetical protein